MSSDKGKGRAADADADADLRDATSSMTPASEWKSIRVTTSTVIQTAVASSLLHLYSTGRVASDAAPSPIVLHTLPLRTASADAAPHISALNRKAVHASLCKLISVVEIIKREFRAYQLKARRKEGQERARRQRAKRLGLVAPINTEPENGDTDHNLQSPDMAGQKRKRRRVDAGEGGESPDARPEACPNEGARQEESLDTTGGAQISSSTEPSPGKQPVMRIYAYNQLDTWENLQSRNQTDGGGQVAAAAHGAGQSSAAEELDQAIHSQVARGRKR